MGIRLINARLSDDGFHWILKVETSLFGLFKRQKEFIGNGTVWNEYPSFRMPASSYDGALYCLWSRAVYQAKLAEPSK